MLLFCGGIEVHYEASIVGCYDNCLHGPLSLLLKENFIPFPMAHPLCVASCLWRESWAVCWYLIGFLGHYIIFMMS